MEVWKCAAGVSVWMCLSVWPWMTMVSIRVSVSPPNGGEGAEGGGDIKKNKKIFFNIFTINIDICI